MEELIITQAYVVDNNDPNRKGKIKIRVVPELEKVIEENLPWAVPFSTIQGSGVLTNDLPSVDSIVRVLVRKDWKRFYYLGNYYFESKFNIESILEQISSLGLDAKYVDLVFRLFEDGGLQFHNNSTGDNGFISKSGSYSIIKSNGDIINHAGATNKIINEGGQIEIKGSSNIVFGGVKITLQGGESGGILETQGSVPPTGSGPYCALPFCVMTGAPHVGSQVILPPAVSSS